MRTAHVSLTQRRVIFWGLAGLTGFLGVTSAIWFIIMLRTGATALAFGLTIPQAIIPGFIVYLATRNAVRLWQFRQTLLQGEGEFDLSGVPILGRFFGADITSSPPLTRAQRRQITKKK